MDENSDLEKPVPQPRNNLLKKPVPLPRTNLSKNKSMAERNEVSSGQKCENETKPKLNYTGSLRKGFRTVSENVHEKGSAVLESTKIVGAKIEKSVRGILSKRLNTSLPDTINKEPGCDNERDHESEPYPPTWTCMFNEIKFGSPLVSPDNRADSTEPGTRSISFSHPPAYPPPPLPDESIYDEVQSSKSSVSGSFYSCPSGLSPYPEPDSYYEEVPRMKKLSLFNESDDSEFSTEPLSLKPKAILRSESWSFYNQPTIISTPPLPLSHPPSSHEYENVSLHNNSVSINSVDNIYSDEPTKFDVVNKQVLIRKSNRSECAESATSSKCLTNELYENWSVSDRSSEDIESSTNQSSLATKSVIYEFDPLFEDDPIVPTMVVSPPKVLQELNETNSSMYADSDVGHSLDPHEKSDSLVEHLTYESDEPVEDVQECTAPPIYDEFDGNSHTVHVKPYTMDGSNVESGETESSERKKVNLDRWSSMKRAIKMVADGKPWSPLGARRTQKQKQLANNIGDPLPTKPSILTTPLSWHQGIVLRSPSNGEKAKDFVQRWCHLGDGKLSFAVDATKTLKDFIQLDTILSIHLINDHKTSVDGEDVYCFEVNTSCRSRSVVVGCLSSSECRVWLQKLLESMTCVFSTSLTACYTVSGWCFLKEGISGSWKSAWVLMEKRILFFSQDKGQVIDIDLRKARCIGLQNDEECFKGCSESGPYILVDSPERALYLQFDNAKETKLWRQFIKMAALNNGSSLHDQQLTKDDLPVIVDKCINFIYAHGSMSEGIYRRSGSNSNITKLLSELRKDAWAVQLSRQDYSEYDVASTLKRFFRDLPESLLSPTLYKYFCNASSIQCSKAEKISMYRHALEQLSRVNYVTARRLIGHLHFIHEQSDKNRMPVDNLAAIWAPTIMHVEGNGGLSWSKKECEVVTDLIQNYEHIFLVDGEEIAREERIKEVLERVHSNLPVPQKPSGDLKIWVYIGSKESGDCVNISVGPHCDAGSICQELCHKTEFGGHELCLTETILSGALSRPLHHTEHVLDTVLRWGYWDNSDCKDNFLVLTPNTVFRELMPIAKPPMTKCGELKYADTKSKSFKTYLFEFSQAKLSYYKDKACSISLQKWNIEDIIWYIGHEPKRNPQSRWAITFVDKNHKVKRSKDNPYFGHTIAGSTKDEQLHWMATLLLGQFPHTDLLPRPNFLE